MGGVAAAAEQGETDGEDAVTDRPRVSSRAGEQEEEELHVGQEEDQHPHPHRKWRQASADALRQADGEGRGRGIGPASLHVLQTEAVHLKDVIHHDDAEQQVESHAHPTNPLTEVHHPPYCGETINNQPMINESSMQQDISQ